MITLHLLVEDDYIQTFVESFQKDKVIIIEKEFEENKKLIQAQLQVYKDNISKFSSYSESMININNWLKESR